MVVFVCNLCGYEYKASEGCPDAGIEEGTDFDDLPEDWVCPDCGASKDEFEPTEVDDDDDDDDNEVSADDSDEF